MDEPQKTVIQETTEELVEHLKANGSVCFLNTSLQGNSSQIQRLWELSQLRQTNITDAGNAREKYLELLRELDAQPRLEPKERVKVVIPERYGSAWKNMSALLGNIEEWGQNYDRFRIENRSEREAGPSKVKIDRFVEDYSNSTEEGKMIMLKNDEGDFVNWRLMAVYNELGVEKIVDENQRKRAIKMAEDAGQAVINSNIIHYPLLASMVGDVLKKQNIDPEKAYYALTTTNRIAKRGAMPLLSQITNAFPIVTDCNPRLLPAYSLTKKKIATAIICYLFNAETPLKKTVSHIYDVQLLMNFTEAIPAISAALETSAAHYGRHTDEKTYGELFKLSNIIYNAMHMRNVLWNLNTTRLRDFIIGHSPYMGYANLMMSNQELYRPTREELQELNMEDRDSPKFDLRTQFEDLIASKE